MVIIEHWAGPLALVFAEHREDLWTHDRVFRAHLLGGIRWALGLEE